MPYTTLVAGTTITASWANANIRDQVVTPFASASARSSAAPTPADGAVSMLQDLPRRFEFYDGAAGLWRPMGTIVECTSTTRPASPRDGQRIWETDLKQHAYWNATRGEWLHDAGLVLVTTSASWTSSATFTTIPAGSTTPNGGVQFPVTANSRYVWALDLHVQANSGVGVAVQCIYPAGGAGDSAFIGTNNTGSFTTAGNQGFASGASLGVVGGTGGTSYTQFHGQIVTTGAAGTVTFGFAQGTANAAASFVLPGTSLSYQQVS